ncbi:MAG: calcium/proton exchanger [Ignavibacteria bacterium]|nr:calcium/proton exchanger [Ignavibacteria bacterium]MBK7184905.1 calcium/proton exchanger [Ignavibacteria bacterium]
MRWLLLLVPAAIGVTVFAPDSPLLVFVTCVLALIPLAALLGEATEHVAAHVGSSIGGLLNATFGNLAELIILTAMLSRGLHEIVLAGILGAILVNAMFASGLSMFVGGLRDHVQEYNRESARDMATLLALAVFGLAVISVVDMRQAESATSGQHGAHGTPIIAGMLFFGYLLYLFYSMYTHKDLFQSRRESHEEDTWSLKKGLLVLLGVTVFVVWLSETLSGAVEAVVATAGLSEVFVGAVVIAVIGGAAEMASAVRAAGKNRLDLALSISMGGSVQIALFVAPALVLVSYLVGTKPLHLVFKPQAVILLFFSVIIMAQLSSDGRSTWFKGALLLIVYLILATAIYLVP